MGNKHVYQQLSGNSKLHAKFYYETVKVINSTWLGDLSITFNQFMHDVSLNSLFEAHYPTNLCMMYQSILFSKLIIRETHQKYFVLLYILLYNTSHHALYSCLLSSSEVVIRWYSFNIYSINTRINQVSNRSNYLSGSFNILIRNVPKIVLDSSCTVHVNTQLSPARLKGVETLTSQPDFFPSLSHALGSKLSYRDFTDLTY